MASRPAAAAALAGLCAAAIGCGLLQAVALSVAMLTGTVGLTLVGLLIGGVSGARWLSSLTPRRDGGQRR